ncbi:MAG: IPT/TIG domain-containing protein [Acidobacteriota bacterium]
MSLSVTLRYPNGGEMIAAGSDLRIQWDVSGATSQRLQYSVDNGANYSPIVTGLPGTQTEYVWRVPAALVPAGQTSVLAAIRVIARDDVAGTTAQDTSNFFFTIFLVIPSIVSVSPAAGPLGGGTQVTINGQNFASGARARFGGVDATQTTFLSPTQLLATTPATTAAGRVNVRVVNPDGQFGVLNDGFEYQVVPAPALFSLSPVFGPLAGGTDVTINGQNFVAGARARFGGVDATQTTFLGSTQLRATTPATATAGFVNVKVTNPDGQAGSLSGAFEYRLPPAPVPTSLSPVAGPLGGGTQVTINGQNFVNGAVARFGGIDAPTIFLSSSQLRATTPAMAAAGSVNVRVTNPDGQFGSLSNAFEYRVPPVPSITALSPTFGPVGGGTEVTINGQNFVTGARARFGGLDAQTTFLGPTQVRAVTPVAMAAGRVTVRVVNPDGQAAVLTDGFEYRLGPAPRIDSVIPGRGPAPTSIPVTVFGANFAVGCTVRFGGVDSPRVTVQNAGQLTADTPAPAAPGVVNVRVTNPDGQSFVATNAFRYDEAPTVVQVSPPEGPVTQSPRQTVTITGTGFQAGARVRFGNGDSPQADVQNATTIQALVPDGLTAGFVAVVVTNPDGQKGRLDNGFRYLGPRQALRARISRVTPSTVLEGIGNELTIRGRNLVAAFGEGLICFHAPATDLAVIETTPVTMSTDPATQEDTVKLVVTVRVVKPGGLGLLERLPIQVIASRRSNAKKDLLVETSRQMFTVVPRTLPVAFGFTARMNRGAANTVIVAGRNLQGTRIEVEHGQGALIRLDDQKVMDDRLVVGVLSIAAEAAAAPVFLRLLDAQSALVGRFQMAIEDPPPLPPLDDPEAAPGDPGVRLEPVGGQVVVGSPKERMTAYDLSTRTYLARGTPDFASANLVVGVTIPIVDVGIEIPLFDEVRLLPFFDRANGLLADVPTQARVGRIFTVRSVALLLVIRVSLRIQVQVALFVGVQVDPFQDFQFGESFNEFPGELPGPIFDPAGTLVVSISVSVTVSLAVSFLLALVRPDGRLKTLAAFDLDLSIRLSSDGRQRLQLGASLYVRAQILGVTPFFPAATQAVQLISDGTVPDRAGYRAYYFARSAATGVCLGLRSRLQLFFSSNGETDDAPLDLGLEPIVCIEVKANASLRGLTLVSDPPATGVPLVLSLNTSDRSRARIRALITGTTTEVKPPDVTFEFAPMPEGSAPSVRLETDANQDTSAVALAGGTGEVRGLLTTAGAGSGVLPSSVLGFVVERFLAAGQPPRVISAALKTAVQALNEITVELAAKPIPRPEPFQPLETVKPLSLKVSGVAGLVPPQLKLRIKRDAVVTFVDPLVRALAVPKVTSALQAGRMFSEAPDARLRRFFSGSLVSAAGQPAPDLPFNLDVAAARSGPVEVTPVTLAANNRETLSAALVPPGGVDPMARTRVTIRFSITVDPASLPAGTTVSVNVPSPEVTFEVSQPETYEEYYRVLTPCVNARTMVFEAFLTGFQQGLKGLATAADLDRYLKSKGEDLFRQSVDRVRAGTGDDRQLYWSRLTAIAMLRRTLQAGGQTPAFIEDRVKAFEDASRGFTTIDFSAAPAGASKVLFTGFDPFLLFLNPARGNPAGLAALKLRDRAMATPSLKDAYIQTCVFPVRWRDFDAGVVERILQPQINGVDMLVTSSEGRSLYYDLEAYAGKNRSDDRTPDNLAEMFTQPNPGTAEFLDSTLPYSGVITRGDLKLDGPDGALAESFILNQGFSRRPGAGAMPVGRSSGMAPDPDCYLKLPLDPDMPPTQDLDQPPQIGQAAGGTNDISIVGSGGGFLSNEVYYRASALRFAMRKTLASGHIHLPVFQDVDVPAKRTLLFNGVGELLKRLLAELRRSSKLPPLRITRLSLKAKPNVLSQAVTVQADNSSGTTRLDIRKVQIYQAGTPFRLSVPSPQPFSVDPGKTVPVTNVQILAGATPGRVTFYGLTVLMLGDNDVPLLRVEVAAKLAPPSISSLMPTKAKVTAPVVIEGKNFIAPLTVQFNTVPAVATIVSPTRITTNVPAGATTGPLEIETPFGRVSRTFTVG